MNGDFVIVALQWHHGRRFATRAAGSNLAKRRTRRMQHDVLAVVDFENAVEPLQDLVHEGLLFVAQWRQRLDDHRFAFQQHRHLAQAVRDQGAPEETRSQMKSALPSLGAISTAPEKIPVSR